MRHEELSRVWLNFEEFLKQNLQWPIGPKIHFKGQNPAPWDKYLIHIQKVDPRPDSADECGLSVLNACLSIIFSLDHFDASSRVRRLKIWGIVAMQIQKPTKTCSKPIELNGIFSIP